MMFSFRFFSEDFCGKYFVISVSVTGPRPGQGPPLRSEVGVKTEALAGE